VRQSIKARKISFLEFEFDWNSFKFENKNLYFYSEESIQLSQCRYNKDFFIFSSSCIQLFCHSFFSFPREFYVLEIYDTRQQFVCAAHRKRSNKKICCYRVAAMQQSLLVP